MPRPSVTTGSANNQTDATTQDLTFTVPADAKVICVGIAGFASGADMSFGTGIVSVQGDPTGTPYNINDLQLVSQTSSDNQYAALFAIYDTNVNWPGSGSVTIRVTYNGSGRQQKSCAFCLADVDTSGTPTNSTNASLTQSDSASTPSQTITSSANALNVAAAGTYSADIGGGDDTVIHEVQNSTSSSSIYVWSEDGTGASDTVEGNASVNWAMVSVSFEGTAASSVIGDLVQSKQNSGGTATITLDSAPTSGNILIYATPNGNSGATLSTPPTGFTELTSNTAANFSFWWGYKVSDGTETSSNHAWSEGNGNSLYAEYYWQQSALNPRVATNENTDNIATAGSGPQGTGSVTPDDISQNFVLAVVAAQFQPNVDGSGAWSNGFTEDVGFAATPTIASVAIASLSSAAAAVETTYSWVDSTEETYGGIAAFSLKSGADFDSGPTVSDVKGSTATITTLAS